MADEATQAPEGTQDTPQEESAPQVEDTRDDAAPEEGHAADEQPEQHDYEKRYNDLRPEYDRSQAALKEAQQAQQVIAALQSDDPQERAWASEVLGIEFEDDEETPDEDGEDEFRDPRVDNLLAEREQEARDRQLAELEAHVDDQIKTLDQKHKTSLDDGEKEWVWSRALSLPPGEDGMPNVEKAFEEFTGIMDARIKRYRESKRDAPSPPQTGGSPGSSQVDLSDRKSRLQRANEVAQRALMREQ